MLCVSTLVNTMTYKHVLFGLSGCASRLKPQVGHVSHLTV